MRGILFFKGARFAPIQRERLKKALIALGLDVSCVTTRREDCTLMVFCELPEEEACIARSWKKIHRLARVHNHTVVSKGNWRYVEGWCRGPFPYTSTTYNFFT